MSNLLGGSYGAWNRNAPSGLQVGGSHGAVVVCTTACLQVNSTFDFFVTLASSVGAT